MEVAFTVTLPSFTGVSKPSADIVASPVPFSTDQLTVLATLPVPVTVAVNCNVAPIFTVASPLIETLSTLSSSPSEGLTAPHLVHLPSVPHA